MLAKPMANEFFSPGEQRAAKVNDLFGAIAARYDFINDAQSFGLHRLWKRQVVKLAAPVPGETALDLCCGTGDIAFALARKGAEATGLDFSDKMLAVARHKQQRDSDNTGTEAPNPYSIQGDAQKTPFPDDSFDIATIGYGLRNLADLDAGLREIHRVLRPGGRLVALEFGKPDNTTWRAIYFGYLRAAVPVFGKLFCGNAAAYAYILESLQHYPEPRAVADKMRDAGLQNVRVIPLLGGVMSIHYGEKKSLPA